MPVKTQHKSKSSEKTGFLPGIDRNHGLYCTVVVGLQSLVHDSCRRGRQFQPIDYTDV